MYTNRMDIKALILNKLAEHGEVKASAIAKEAGVSRAYVYRFINALKDEGKIVSVGKTSRARLIVADKKAVAKAKHEILDIHRVLRNINLLEDRVLDEIKKDTGIYLELPRNVSEVLDYAFTEMLNNAIEHSQSETIEVKMSRNKTTAEFDVIDYGVGIFNNIMQKRNLRNELEAIQDLLKGKQTTDPESHTGEGIFFTSKVADALVIQSSTKKLTFNNIVDDIFISAIKDLRGTRIKFALSVNTHTELNAIFKKYSEGSYEFNKTSVAVRLYKIGSVYISRSQARRIMAGLDKFKFITLDFKHIRTVGQAFADEVFRVWQRRHSAIRISVANSNENIDFIIKRAREI